MMQEWPSITDVVVCFWAEARNELIERVRHSVCEAGLYAQSDWAWYQGIDGFLPEEHELIGRLVEIADAIADTAPSQDHEALHLAARWISGATMTELDTTDLGDEVPLLENTM